MLVAQRSQLGWCVVLVAVGMCACSSDDTGTTPTNNTQPAKDTKINWVGDDGGSTLIDTAAVDVVAPAGDVDAGSAQGDVVDASTTAQDTSGGDDGLGTSEDTVASQDGGAGAIDGGVVPVLCLVGGKQVCKSNQFCKLLAASKSCAGQGQCAPKKCDCPKLLKPVCGCDGQTYNSPCLAGCKGQNIKSDGKCPQSVTCGDGKCQGKENCQTCAKDCGKCPNECKVHADCVDQKKCTIDTCELGKCLHTVIPQAACDMMCVIGKAGECKPGQYCDAYSSNKVGICSGLGACLPLSTKPCKDAGAPVCGCDNKTYLSACHAKQNGVNVRSNGVCPDTGSPCKSGWFKPYSGGPCVEANCTNMKKWYAQDLSAAINKSIDCSADADCVIVQTWSDCAGTCGSSVNTAKKDEVKSVVAWLDKNICKAFGFKSKCPFAQPKCMAPKPGCVAGKCVYKKP